MTTCASCHVPMPSGAALLVTERATGRSWHVHRYGVKAACFARVGPADRTSIAFADPAAAREYDRALGGPVKNRGDIDRLRFALEDDARHRAAAGY